MSAKPTHDVRTDADRVYPLEWAYPSDEDLLEPSPSTGWRETGAIMHALERVRATTRRDRPERYRRKHRRGVSS